MTMNLNAQVLNKLTAIKLLLNDANRKANAAGTQRAFAILHTHDALDWMLQVAYTHPKVGGKKNKKIFLLDYAREIEKHEPGLLDQGNISKLNTLRVNFKHDLIFPDPKHTKEIVAWAENQINTVCQRLFKTSLADVDLTAAVDNKQVKAKIKEADNLFAEGKTVDAFCSLSIAFEMIKHHLQDKLEKTTGKKAVFGTDLSFSSSFFLKLDLFGGDFARAWDQIVNSTKYLVDMSFVNFLGIEANEYFQFQSTTPRSTRTINGKYHCNISDRLAKSLQTSKYKKCRDFLIEAAIKAQSKML